MQDKAVRAIHPRNRYADAPPDFSQLASRHASFKAFVFYDKKGNPCIDWTSSAATRELTRVLLLDDYGVHWDIPEGQLCPTVTSRANYIHWLADLLALSGKPSPDGPAVGAASTRSGAVMPPPATASGSDVRGLDIGVGANCIYPLLGASIHGWSFVGTDTTPVAIEWARWNVGNNLHLAHLIEIRQVAVPGEAAAEQPAAVAAAEGVEGAPPGDRQDVPAQASLWHEHGASARSVRGGDHQHGCEGPEEAQAIPSGDNGRGLEAKLAPGHGPGTPCEPPVDAPFRRHPSTEHGPNDSVAASPSSCTSGSPAAPIGPALPPGILVIDATQAGVPSGQPGPPIGPSWDPAIQGGSASGPASSRWEGSAWGVGGPQCQGGWGLAEGHQMAPGWSPTSSSSSCNVLVGVVRQDERFDFCMCNPPFFESIEQANQNPLTACGGTAQEMVTPGGEVAFIHRMIADSLVLRGQITWYTSMVGRKASLKSLTETLHAHEVPVIRTTEFVQGRTSRWGLAWTFSMAVADALKSDVRSKLLATAVVSAPARAKVSFSVQNASGADAATRLLSSLKRSLSSLGGTAAVDKATCSMLCTMPLLSEGGSAGGAYSTSASVHPGAAPSQGVASPVAQGVMQATRTHGKPLGGGALPAAAPSSLLPCKRSAPGEEVLPLGSAKTSPGGQQGLARVYKFRIDVMQPAPGSLVVSSVLDRDRQGLQGDAYTRVCEHFSQAMAAVEQHVMRSFAKARHAS
eukprot:jgi/Mesvir1/20324/Mv19914-RA.1